MSETSLQNLAITGKPRSRGACKTCKIRHLKCDETKPLCDRCSKNGFVCDGYSTRKSTPAKPKGIPKLWKLSFYHPKQAIGLDEQEHRYFSLFRKSMAPQLAGYFDSNLWEILILQACERDVSIKHAIIALAALKKWSLEFHSLSSIETLKIQHSNSRAHYQFALKHYSKAIRSMKKATVDGKQDLKTTLITCIVIICFETYVGGYESALKQAIIGLNLIEARKTGKSTVQVKIPSVDEELLQTFARLDIQAMSYIDPRPKSQHAILKDAGQEEVDAMPNTFSDWKEARMYLVLLVGRILHLMSSFLPNNNSTGCLSLDFLSPMPTSHVEERKKHLLELERWYSAFLKSKETQGTATDDSFLVASGLELQYLTIYFSAAIIRTEDEPYSNTRSFMPVFSKVVSLAENILTHPSKRSKSHTYEFEMHLICPLYGVAWRCPSRVLRRKAIALLLEYPRREAFWDSVVTGKLAEWIVGIEEEGMADEEFVREDRRARGIEISEFDLVGKRVRVKCLVQSREEGGKWIEKGTVISWG